MLSKQPVDALLLVTDLEVAREFYERKLGLEVLFEDGEQFITFGCGGDSRVVVTKSSVGTKDEATKVSWRVDDIVAEVAELRTRGVEILEFPDLNTVDGIADVGFALAAWFEDPSKNSLGLLQLKGDITH